MKAAIAGVTGYTGLLLTRLLLNHPEVGSLIPISSSKTGMQLLDADAGIGEESLEKLSITDGKLISLNEAEELKPDVIFAALPHLKSAELMAPFFHKCVIVDLSADFRIKDKEVFKKAYGRIPPRPDLLEKSIYGLCEWYKDKIKNFDIIANPGCYPTAALLPLLPLAAKGFIKGKVIINAISGISGAGKKLSDNLLYCERSENAGAYLPGKKHRHMPEIAHEIGLLDNELDVFFTPHLAPMKRGIATTTAAFLIKNLSDSDMSGLYNEYYAEAPFIYIRENNLPQTHEVWGSNRCDIGWQIEGDTILLFSAIDNLVKGASGQAIQNMNIRFGFNETAGLKTTSEL
jgi:N-acetyl-gamma-glutamyl-phosphate reductase